jgi:excisionase family DNA binding protein
MSTVSAIPGFVTAEEAAEIIGVHHSQVCRYCIEKQLPARKVGNQWLIKRSDARKFKRRPVGNPEFQKK